MWKKGGEGSEFDWAISEKPQQKHLYSIQIFILYFEKTRKKQLMFD